MYKEPSLNSNYVNFTEAIGMLKRGGILYVTEQAAFISMPESYVRKNVRGAELAKLQVHCRMIQSWDTGTEAYTI